MKKNEKYYLGLDIGTDSIGWAVTNSDYSICKRKSKSLWGVHLFEAGKTAAERRKFRIARRRLQRRNERLSLLQALFSEEIAKLDPGFFQRMKDSKYYSEDKSEIQVNSLFNDCDFTDKEYHSKYPTIYHLRKALVESEEKFDLRLVYLAIHHLVKKRGHFLREGMEVDIQGDLINVPFESLIENLTVFEILSEDVLDKLRFTNLNKLSSILCKTGISRSQKRDELIALWVPEKKTPDGKKTIEIAKALAGLEFSFQILFDDESLKDAEIKKISFDSGIEDDKDDAISATLQERSDIIRSLKAVYDWSVLANIIRNNEYLSQAKVKDYDKHKSDLKFLKKIVKEFIPSRYNAIFKDISLNNNYVSYSGKANIAAKKLPIEKKCDQCAFCDFLKKELKDIKDLILQAYPREGTLMLNEINDYHFMPKVVTKDNSVIPYQIHEKELKKILGNALKHYEFLQHKDQNGLSVAEKISALFSFRIPYFVGPLNPHSERSWIKREYGKIYPWNFEKMVNLEDSAEAFISNLTAKCSFLYKEDVLPKNSLQYCRYIALNLLNKLKIDDKPISVDLKQELYREFFEKRRCGVTKAKIAKYLTSSHPEMGDMSAEAITGIDDDPNLKITSYCDLQNILGDGFNEIDAEEIIKSIVFLGDEKKMLKKRIKRLFPNLSDEQIKKLSNLRYRDWGRLSSKLLTGITWKDPTTSVSKSILTLLWEQNENLMELLPRFKTAIEAENANFGEVSLDEKINALYVSPSIKRSIRQTCNITKEIQSILKNPPAKIFIEMARGPQEKKRTVSRKKMLDDLYAQCKTDSIEIKREINNLRASLDKTSDDRMRQDRLYLYYTQLGKCAYSGESIDLESLISGSKDYDIDHIYPQSKIKDDSLTNRVLVCAKANRDKRETYPLNPQIQNKQRAFWKRLKDCGLIPDEKFIRLMRTTPLTEEDINVFINRQLVETRQSTKAIGQLLKELFPDSKLVYVKAKLVSDFRNGNNQFVPNDRNGTHSKKFLKCRDINDLHHAKDAYLNIVVGNVYDTKYTNQYFLRNVIEGKASVNRLFAFPVEGGWTPGADGSIAVVDKTMWRNDILFTRYATIKHFEFFDQNILKKGKGQVPIKGSDPRLCNIEKYGGYKKAKGAFFCLVEYSEKNKLLRKILPVLIHNRKLYEENPRKYLKQEYGIENGNIIVPCIKYDTLILKKGFPVHLSSKSNDSLWCKPAVQLFLSPCDEEYFRKVAKLVAENKELKGTAVPCEAFYNGIDSQRNADFFNMLINKMRSKPFNTQFTSMANKIEKNAVKFNTLCISEQCRVICEISRMLKCNMELANMSLIGLAGKAGAITTPQLIKEDIRLVSQSVTGFYEKSIDLRTYSGKTREG